MLVPSKKHLQFGKPAATSRCFDALFLECCLSSRTRWRTDLNLFSAVLVLTRRPVMDPGAPP